MRICCECIEDIAIKEYIKSQGSIGNCYLCNEEEISIEIDANINNMIKTLMRYHYADNADLNMTFDCLYKENKIIKVNKDICSGDDFQDFLFDLIGKYYPAKEEGVQFIEDKKWPYLVPIMNSIHGLVQKWEKELEYKNYYSIFDDIKDNLKLILTRIQITRCIEESYRARIGVEYEIQRLEEGFETIYISWKGSEIGAPPVKLAKEGRFNRKRISFLYIASDVQTAIAEIKPSIGQKISVGKFKSKKELRLLNFKSIDIHDFWKNEDDIENFILLNSLRKRFSLPRANGDYYFTQIISEVIRSLGYDGIIYDSSVNSGYNYLVFDPPQMEYISGFDEIFSIKSIIYEKSNIRANINLIRPDEWYYYEGMQMLGEEVLHMINKP